MQERLKKDMQNALKEKDDVTLRTLRSVLGAITNELVAQKKKPTETLSDNEIITVIQKEAKKRKEAIEQFNKGNRSDLSEREEEELRILKNYLPEMMSEEEIRSVVEKTKKELGDVQKGILIGTLMKALKGKADGGIVKKIVDEMM